MKDITTMLLINTLRATVAHLDAAIDLDPNFPGLREFRHALLVEIQKLNAGVSGLPVSKEIPAA